VQDTISAFAFRLVSFVEWPTSRRALKAMIGYGERSAGDRRKLLMSSERAGTNLQPT